MSNITGQNRIAYQLDSYTNAPRIQTKTLPDALLGTPYIATMKASTPVTWSITDGALPAGLTLNASTGTIMGTPTLGGTYTFEVGITDGETSASRQYTISVEVEIQTTELVNGVKDRAYQEQLEGSVGLIWGVESGELPAGLTLTSAGLLSGTPTEGGSYTFTVSATSGTKTATREYSIEIYTQDVPVTSVIWSAENLPEGLSLSQSGVLSGTPTTLGLYTSTITVRTNWGRASRTVNIRVTSGS